MKLSELIRGGIPVKEYCQIHHWIRKNYGSANKCENPRCSGKSKRYEWSLKKGCQYEKKRENFDMLCGSCHRKRDITDKTREKMSKRMTGQKFSEETKKKMSEIKKGIFIPGKNFTSEQWIKYIRNKRGKKCMFNGELRNFRDLCDEYGVDRTTVSYRMNNGIYLEEALTKPVRKFNKKI